MSSSENKTKVVCTTKQFQIYEILNKIQNVINTESLLPQFIYFARTMEEMRKKWLQTEIKCKELENKLNLEKSMFQRKINELKIDIEMHHEKRLQAENKSDRLQTELEKMQNQFAMFKEVLHDGNNGAGDRNYGERLNILSAIDLNAVRASGGLRGSPYQFNGHNYNQNMLDRDLHMKHDRANTSRRLTIEDTGSIISDYTEDDIDVGNDDDEDINTNIMDCYPNNHIDIQKAQQQTTTANPGVLYNMELPPAPPQAPPPAPPAQPHRERERERESTGRKRNQHRNSGSLTRLGGERRDKKQRSRTKSNPKTTTNQENIPPSQAPPTPTPRSSNQGGAITTITSIKIGEDGRPITVTSEIKHNSHHHKQQENVNTGNSSKMELNFVPQRVKNKKKRESRPSREFLQRSVDESLTSNGDYETFWNDDALIDEVSHEPHVIQQQQNLHIMTPIVEAPTPTHQHIQHQRIYSNYKPKYNAAATPKIKSLSGSSMPLSKKYKRAHLFKGQVILNSELCAHCDKRTKFGKMIMKCRECDMVVHNECKDLLARPCYPAFNFPQHGAICDYVLHEESPHIPPIVQMVINEIEQRGLLQHEVGLYRVNGSDTQIKHLKERLVKRHQAPDLRKILDVHVLCSFLKDFLNNLNEHLITYESWFRFARACDHQNEAERLPNLQEAVQDLPQANRDTLSFLILHLQRISDTPECKMPSSNLARVFGPSVVGNSSPQMAPAEIINELKVQHSIVENLIKIPSSFYMSFVDGLDQPTQQRLFKNCAKTPELMRKSKTATVLSSILGPATNVPSSSLKYNN